jgi:hypothetical protein
MNVRLTRPSDLVDLNLDWLIPDGEFDYGVSMVEEAQRRVVAAGVRRFTRTGASRDGVDFYCEAGHGSQLLRKLATAAERPIILRIIPGTPAETAASKAGGRVVQSVPAAFFDTSHRDVQTWAQQQLDLASNRKLTLRSGEEYSVDELLDLWMPPYLRMHQAWAPPQDVQAARGAFRGLFAQDLDRTCTVIAHLDGQPLAAVFTIGPFDGARMPILVEIERRHPGCALAARAVIAMMLTTAHPLPVEFDGHADEPTYMRILEEIPHRTSGNLTPMNLVEIQ